MEGWIDFSLVLALRTSFCLCRSSPFQLPHLVLQRHVASPPPAASFNTRHHLIPFLTTEHSDCHAALLLIVATVYVTTATRNVVTLLPSSVDPIRGFTSPPPLLNAVLVVIDTTDQPHATFRLQFT